MHGKLCFGLNISLKLIPTGHLESRQDSFCWVWYYWNAQVHQQWVAHTSYTLVCWLVCLFVDVTFLIWFYHEMDCMSRIMAMGAFEYNRFWSKMYSSAPLTVALIYSKIRMQYADQLCSQSCDNLCGVGKAPCVRSCTLVLSWIFRKMWARQSPVWEKTAKHQQQLQQQRNANISHMHVIISLSVCWIHTRDDLSASL